MSEVKIDQKYVLNDLEVKLTGRVAVKRSKTGRNPGSVISTVYEVSPADTEEGSWKKWVKFTDLYEIIETE